MDASPPLPLEIATHEKQLRIGEWRATLTLRQSNTIAKQAFYGDQRKHSCVFLVRYMNKVILSNNFMGFIKCWAIFLIGVSLPKFGENLVTPSECENCFDRNSLSFLSMMH